MKLILRVLLTAVAVVLIANILPGVSVKSYGTAILVAIVLALLNTFLKPILVILTLPVTILTLGLFLLIINAVIILLIDSLVSGFSVSSIWTAVLFSLLLAVLQWALFALIGEE